ncbi:unnamed protein product [Rotaria sp. Silwood1]|nr:unnamed protein product [Rotaria sp. Silwood1]
MNNITKECPDVSVTTNYGGYCYFGEYSLSFAAVLQQEKSVRLLVAKDADTNLLHVLFGRIDCDNDFATVIETFFHMFCVILQQVTDAYENLHRHRIFAI